MEKTVFFFSLFAAVWYCFHEKRYLDAAGMKMSRLYVINGVIMFVTWLVSKIGTCDSFVQIILVNTDHSKCHFCRLRGLSYLCTCSTISPPIMIR